MWHAANLEFHFFQISHDVSRLRADAGDGAGVDAQGLAAFDIGDFFDARAMFMAVAHEIVIAGERQGLGIMRVVHQEDFSAGEGEAGILTIVSHEPLGFMRQA